MMSDEKPTTNSNDTEPQGDTPSHDDLHDRLIDGALREMVGAETPPDLSEQILFTATGEHSQQLSTLAPGEDSMTALDKSADQSATHIVTTQKRNRRIGATLAASLLIGSALILPKFLADHEMAKKDKLISAPVLLGRPAQEAVTESPTNKDGRLNLDASGQDATESLMLAVTPHIIIQDGKEKHLGFPIEDLEGQELNATHESIKANVKQPETDFLASNGPTSVAPKVPTQSFGYTPSGSMGLQGLIGKQASFPAFSVDLETPFRRSTFYSQPQQESGNGTMPFGVGVNSDAGLVGSLATGVISADSRYVRTKALESKIKELQARHNDFSQKIKLKIDRFDALSTEFGGTESINASPALQQKIIKVRQIHEQLTKAKDALMVTHVQKELAMQQATGTTAIEQALQMKLSKDPTIATYKTEEFAMMLQIRALKANSKRGTSPDIKRLKKSLAALQQESQQYRKQTEVALREELHRSPNDLLNQINKEHRLRTAKTKSDIAKHQKELNALIAEISKVGDYRTGELAMLQREINQLQANERQLGDQYTPIYENPFIEAQGKQAVSTFSIDVDTASYANVRQFLMRSGQLPPPDAVRIEELVNYFDYDYSAPTESTPFASNVEIAGCPWQPEHRLVRVGIKGREIATDHRPPSNLVFLIDVSGSMNEPAKLPLLVSGLKMMTRQLGENDSVAIVVYASSEGLALPSTRGDKQETILAALEKLRAGGSTAGGAGIELAYKLAKENFIEGGVNRVILATDGDFNVGTTNTADLERIAEAHAKETGVFLTVLGFGRGNLNDAMMEKISGKGNGNYHYIDNQTEARKVLVAEMAGTLVTIAKDVKLQIEFNPAQVAAYRLIGYENRMLKTEDFNDDKKDAGEIGAGHTVTAIYEVVPVGVKLKTPKVDALKYQQPAKVKKEVATDIASDTVIDADDSGELLTLKIRYKQPDGDKSTKLEFPITDNGQTFAEASQDFKFASAVASFGMQLRHSQHRGITSYGAIEEIAESNLGTDKHGYRAEFLQMIRQVKILSGE